MTSFVRRARILQRKRKCVPRFITLTTKARELDRIEGYGALPLERLLVLAEDAYLVERRDALANGQSAEEFAEAVDDQVVWDGGRVVALLRSLPDGCLEVARFARAGRIALAHMAGVPRKGGVS